MTTQPKPWEGSTSWDAYAESYAQGSDVSGSALFQAAVELLTDWLQSSYGPRPFVLLDVASGPGE